MGTRRTDCATAAPIYRLVGGRPVVNSKTLEGVHELTTNPRREALIELLADPHDRRTKEQKALVAGYKSGKEVFRLQRQPEFRQAVLARLREHLGVNLAAVYRRLFHIAETGTDAAAIRACDSLLRAAGEIASGSTTQVVNVKQTAADDDGSGRRWRGGSEPETLEEAADRVWRSRLPEQTNNDDNETD